MLKAAAELTRDLNAPSRRIYWADLLASAVLGYARAGAAIDRRLDRRSRHCRRRGRGARAVPRGQLHPRAHAYQAERRSAASGWSGT